MRIKYGIKITYYENKSYKFNNEFLQKLIYLKNNKLNGEYKMWYRDGRLGTYCHFKNNREDGEYVEYDDYYGDITRYLIFEDGRIVRSV